VAAATPLFNNSKNIKDLDKSQQDYKKHREENKELKAKNSDLNRQYRDSSSRDDRFADELRQEDNRFSHCRHSLNELQYAFDS
jgi:hypothetical protein